MAEDLSGSIAVNVQLVDGGGNGATAPASTGTAKTSTQGQGTDQAPSKTEDSPRQRQFTLRNLLQLSIMGVSLASLARSSTILGTFFGSYFKVLGAMFDMILAPFTPVFQLILSYLIKAAMWLAEHIGPYIKKLVDWFMKWPSWAQIAALIGSALVGGKLVQTLAGAATQGILSLLGLGALAKTGKKVAQEGAEVAGASVLSRAGSAAKTAGGFAVMALTSQAAAVVGILAALGISTYVVQRIIRNAEQRDAALDAQVRADNAVRYKGLGFYSTQNYPEVAQRPTLQGFQRDMAALNSTLISGNTLNMNFNTVRDPSEIAQVGKTPWMMLNINSVTRGR